MCDKLLMVLTKPFQGEISPAYILYKISLRNFLTSFKGKYNKN